PRLSLAGASRRTGACTSSVRTHKVPHMVERAQPVGNRQRLGAAVGVDPSRAQPRLDLRLWHAQPVADGVRQSLAPLAEAGADGTEEGPARVTGQRHAGVDVDPQHRGFGPWRWDEGAAADAERNRGRAEELD